MTDHISYCFVVVCREPKTGLKFSLYAAVMFYPKSNHYGAIAKVSHVLGCVCPRALFVAADCLNAKMFVARW